MLQIGQTAPEFALPDQEGKEHHLSDFRGQKVVVYFYPRDNTPGCTREAQAFKAAYDAYREKNVAVVGISKDSQASHQKFKSKYELPFLLLSDPELTAIKAYGVWQIKKLYGRESYGVVRSTYLIDENGAVEKVYDKVKPDLNASEILAYLEKGK
ncbi:MAG: thioredoxin-dependent thiol peroxidase [Eubacteriales bacterium]|nr:thioredoxin-dependent thiol peroxidase [Eubacteriales bacterium]